MTTAPAPTEERWLFWQDSEHSPAENMAADEALLLSAVERAQPLLRFYSWDCKAVSLGYVQRHDAAPAGFAFVRRPTGGGVVYHDFDFTYSVTFPMGHWLTGLDRFRSYDCLNQSVQRGLCSLGLPVELAKVEIPHSVERATMVCFTNPTRYDLLLEGKKIAGSAQRRTAHGLLHQGSLHFGGPLPFDKKTLGEAICAGLAEVMKVTLEPFTPDEKLLGAITELTANKYGTDEWNCLR